MKGVLNNVNFIGVIYMIRQNPRFCVTSIFRELLCK